jgi:hypothetical protein
MLSPYMMPTGRWPADLPDRATISAVFQAYGPSHTAILRSRDLSDSRSDVWVTCSCGLSTAPKRVDRGSFLAAMDEAEVFADRHVEETRG